MNHLEVTPRIDPVPDEEDLIIIEILAMAGS
jgi:hypothetical protein